MSNPYRVCQQCGTQLALNQAFCGSCGAHASDRVGSAASLAPEQPASPGPSTPSVSSSQPGVGPTVYAFPPPYAVSPYNNTNYGLAQPTHVPSPPPPPPDGSNQGYPGAYRAYGAYGQFPLQASPLPTTPPVSPFPPQVSAGTPKRKGRTLRVIALLAGGVVFLFILLCVIGLLVTSKGSITSSSSHSTANAQSTPTVTVTPTLAPTPTPTLPPTSQALFTDNFTDNSNNWDVGAGSGYSSEIGNNLLMMKEVNHKIFRERLPTNVSYNDFSIKASFTLLTGDQNDSAGLYMRASSDNLQGYYVEVAGDNTYDIVKVAANANQKNQASYLVKPTQSSFLQPEGQQNSITVIMKGQQIVLLINNNVVTTVSDGDFHSGPISLFVQNGDSSGGVEASFDSVAVYNAPDQLPV